MGAGGVLVPPRSYFEKIGAVCARHGVYMISDEVICGFGRLGAMWGCDTLGFKPHSISVAKALSSAYVPIAAVMLPELMYEAMLTESRKIGSFAHGFTYAAHPVAAAVAVKTLDILVRDRIVDQVGQRSVGFQARLRALGEHPLVGEARGLGLVGAVELVADKRTKRSFEPAQGVGNMAMRFAEEQGLIVRALANDAISLCPPLIISEDETDEMFRRLERALDQTLDWAKREGLLAA
jgi:4-aminobutyrate--pyruvate transaminase